MSPKFEDLCFCKCSEWPVRWREAGRALWGRKSSGKAWKPIYAGKGRGEKGEWGSGLPGSPEEFPQRPGKGSRSRKRPLGTGEAEPSGAGRKKRRRAGSLLRNRWQSRCKRRKQRKGASPAPRCVWPQLLKRPNKASPLLWQLP